MSPRQRSPLTIEYILLGLLFKNPKHGYELHKVIKHSQEISTIWYVKPGKLYSLLERLENDGLLSSKYIPSEKTPGRKEFCITEEGKCTFLNWILLPVRKAREMRLVFHARLYFALDKGGETAFKLIEAQRKECRRWTESMHSQLVEDKEPDFITKQIFNYRIGQIEAVCVWLDKCEKDIIERMKV